MIRQAKIHGRASKINEIRKYLPSNYKAFTFGNDVFITGKDENGWTLLDYVIPRLGSGLFIAKVVY